ncbi:MAG: MBL fold metallo-hydrolase [Oscillospiraceae bacterium]|nr:MBL fold metallo-hydrolase [Oscillospiraceae bacterium]
MKRLFIVFIAVILLFSGCSIGREPPAVSGDELIVTFLDVGQADAALIECGGQTMLIDGGNPSDSDLIYTVLKNKNITYLDYIVATHAHADHVGGLAGALRFANAGTALCPVKTYDSRAFENFVRALEDQGVSITIPKPGDTFNLGGAEIVILGPVNIDNIESDDPNNTSVVLKITYGKTSFLFTGDAERKAEQDILEMGADLSATVLKAGHHGSNTSTTYPFLREIMPQFAVISCGKGNSYGHPHDDLLSRLRDADVTVYRTDLQGDVICVSDGQTVSIQTERNASTQTNPTEPSALEEGYIGNVNSLRFHRPSCSGLPAEQNRVWLESREAAIDAGYDPCGTCKP